MPGVSHAFALPPTALQSSSNLRLSMECASMKATPGKQLKLDSSKNSSVTEKSQRDKSKVQLAEQSNTTEFAENKPKSSSSGVSGGKVCKTRPSVLSSCSQHSQPPEYSSAVSKQKTLHTCTSCSSTEVIEVNIKLMSCQNCQNVVIDELNYDNQPVDKNDESREKRKNSNSSNASTSGGVGLNFYHQQLMVITKKLKNMYKNRIHSSYADDQQDRPQNSGKVQSSIPPTEPIVEPAGIFASAHGPSTSNMVSSVDKRRVRSVASQNTSVKFSNSICNNHCYSNNLPTDDRDGSTSKTSSISTLPFKSSSNYNSNVVNKDALILRICDLDDKLKPMRNDSSMPVNKTTCINGNKVEGNTSSVKTLKNGNVDFEGNKKVSPKLAQASQRNNRKIVIISNEYKNKSEKNDVYIRDRKELIKLFQQNKSKSLDLLPPSKHSNKFSSRKKTQDQVFSSQSVMNLPNQESVDEIKNANSCSDDDGPYESINSVELIFISDEFLNKAVKHDLKILKSKQTATENSMRSTSSLKKKVRTLEATTSPIKTLKPEDCCVDNPQTPSPISPDNYQITSQRAAASRPSLTGSKKLIVISEDFKRKSLENNVVIVDACTNDSNCIGEAIDKRKKFQQTKRFSRQQSSIDDVANQMISHAFRSFEEPDEQCLESKELKTPE